MILKTHIQQTSVFTFRRTFNANRIFCLNDYFAYLPFHYKFFKRFFFLIAVGTPILNRVTSGFLEDQLF
jgi:hypothetical protein